MIETLTMRTSKEEWRKDLDLGLGNIGRYRMHTLRQSLIRSMNELAAMINEYEGMKATLIVPKQVDPYWIGLKVQSADNVIPFIAHVSYAVSEQHRLYVQLHFTERPSTEEFPVSEGVVWKTSILDETEIKDVRYVVANVKNDFIKFESFRTIGRDIIYAVAEE